MRAVTIMNLRIYFVWPNTVYHAVYASMQANATWAAALLHAWA